MLSGLLIYWGCLEPALEGCESAIQVWVQRWVYVSVSNGAIGVSRYAPATFMKALVLNKLQFGFGFGGCWGVL